MNEEIFKHYKVGVDSMDAQHWKLFEALDKITHAMPKAVMIQHASELLQMWQSHHAAEEEYMEKLAFPYALAHIESHKQLTQQFEKLVNNTEVDNRYTNDYFKTDLEKLLTFHIDNFDSQYAAWAKKLIL